MGPLILAKNGMVFFRSMQMYVAYMFFGREILVVWPFNNKRKAFHVTFSAFHLKSWTYAISHCSKSNPCISPYRKAHKELKHYFNWV